MKDSKITIISTGPGAPDLITVRAMNAINEQDIILGNYDLLETFAKGKNTYSPEKLFQDTVDFINTCSHEKIGVLVSGDAGFFSLAKTLEEKFDVDIIPGVSSVNAAFALLKKQWNSFRFYSIHGRDIFDKKLTGSSVILCDSENTPDRFIEKHPYVRDEYKIYIMKDISLETEHLYTKTQGGYDSSRLLLILEKK